MDSSSFSKIVSSGGASRHSKAQFFVRYQVFQHRIKGCIVWLELQLQQELHIVIEGIR